MRSLFFFHLFVLFSFAESNAWAVSTRLCNIEIEAPEKIDFSSTEEKWLCGDRESAAWQSIPPSQQKVFLRSFLQSKGFHEPSVTENEGQIFVNTGAPRTVKDFEVIGGPPSWDWSRKWNLDGKGLAPETLNEAENWAKRDLQENGYPCPAISPLAFVDTGLIRLLVQPGPSHQLGQVESPAPGDLDPAILERFTAFVPGQEFDIRLLELSSSRLLQEDLYLSSYYDILCAEDQSPRIARRFVPALPRLFTLGAGFDTDRGPLARARMKWARLGRAANSIEVSAFASIREQSLESRYHYHFTSDLSSRVKLVPLVSVKREVEKLFSTITTQAGVNLANSWEFEKYQLSAEAGPLIERVNERRGEGPKRVDNIKLGSKISATSHLFEYYLSNPREGWMVTAETTSQFDGVMSEQSVHRLTLQHQLLWNLGGWEPPYLILGWRGQIGTYFFSQRTQDPEDIAVNQRYFLGGDENIRGFARKELPGDGRGFFTSLYQGFELRTGPWFPLHLQPFLFFDFAKGGRRPQKLDPASYYAPGFGLRYDSPIGTVRASLGRGFSQRSAANDPTPHWQFFFSFGREF